MSQPIRTATSQFDTRALTQQHSLARIFALYRFISSLLFYTITALSCFPLPTRANPNCEGPIGIIIHSSRYSIQNVQGPR